MGTALSKKSFVVWVIVVAILGLASVLFFDFLKKSPQTHINKLIEEATSEEGTGMFSTIGSGDDSCYSLFEKGVIKLHSSCFSGNQDFKHFIIKHQGLLSITITPTNSPENEGWSDFLSLWYNPLNLWWIPSDQHWKTTKIKDFYTNLLNQDKYFGETSDVYTFNVWELIKEFLQKATKTANYEYILPLLHETKQYHLQLQISPEIYKSQQQELIIAPHETYVALQNSSIEFYDTISTQAFSPIFNGSGELLVPIGEGNQIEVQLSSHQGVHSIRILPEYHQEWGDERFSIDLNLPLLGKNADEEKTNQVWNPLPSWVEEFGIEGESQEYGESYDYPRNERNNTITVDSLNPFVIFVDKQKYLNLTVLSQLGTGYTKLDRTFFEQSEITQISAKTSHQWEYSNFYYEKPFTPSRLKQGELRPLSPTIDEACTTQASGDVLIFSKACFESKDDFKRLIRDLWWNDIGLQYHFEEISYEIYWEDGINKLFCIKHDFHDTKEAIWLQECSKLFPRLKNTDTQLLVQKLSNIQTLNPIIADFLQENEKGDYLLDLNLVKKQLETKYPQVSKWDIIGWNDRSYGGTRYSWLRWIIGEIRIDNKVWELNWTFPSPLKYINTSNAILDYDIPSRGYMNVFYDNTWDIFVPLKETLKEIKWANIHFGWHRYLSDLPDFVIHIDSFNHKPSADFHWLGKGTQDQYRPFYKPFHDALFSYNGINYLNLTKLSPTNTPFNYTTLQKYSSEPWHLRIEGWNMWRYAYYYPWKANDYTQTISTFVANIRSPKNVSTDPQVIVLNIVLALIYLGLFMFCKEKLSDSISSVTNYFWRDTKIKTFWKKCHSKISLVTKDFITSYWKKQKKNRKCLVTTFLTRFQKTRGYGLLYYLWNYKNWRLRMLTGGVFLGNFILSFISPSFSLFSLSGILFWVFMTVITTLSDKLKDIILYMLIKIRKQWSFNYTIFPTGYIYAVISVVLNRVFHLIPSMVFAKYLAKQPKNIHIKDIIFSNVFFFVLWVLIWLSTASLSEGIVFDFLLGTAFGIFNSVFWDMLPKKTWEGAKIREYNKWIWWCLFLVSLFIFFHLIFNPDDKIQDVVGVTGKYASVLSAFMTGSGKMLIIALILLLVTLWLNRYTHYLNKISKI